MLKKPHELTEIYLMNDLGTMTKAIKIDKSEFKILQKNTKK